MKHSRRLCILTAALLAILLIPQALGQEGASVLEFVQPAPASIPWINNPGGGSYQPPVTTPTSVPFDPFNPFPTDAYYPYITPTPSPYIYATPTPASYTYATVAVSDGSYGVLYSEATTSSAPHGSFQNGTSVKIYSRGSDWSLVEVSGLTGYMQTRYLYFGGGVTAPPSGNIYESIVLPTGYSAAPFYAEARESSTRLGSLGNNTSVRILRQASDWYQVEVNGVAGYIQAKFFKSSGNGTSGLSYMYVKPLSGVSTVPLYLMADTTSSVLGSFTAGTRVQLVTQTGSWSMVDVGNYRGYMQTAYLSSSNPTITAPPSTTGYAVVSNQNPNDKLNLRSRATTASSSLGRYKNGTSVRIIEYGAEWCHVEVSGQTGYMATRYLSVTKTPTLAPGQTATPAPSGGSGTLAVVNNKNPRDMLNLRASASASSASIGRYAQGTQVKVLEKGSTWCRVEVGGKTGYMITSNLSFLQTPIVTPTPGPLPTATPVGMRKAIVTARTIHLYAFPSTASISLQTFNNGTSVDIVSYGSQWCQVEIKGQQGYVLTKNIALR